MSDVKETTSTENSSSERREYTPRREGGYQSREGRPGGFRPSGGGTGPKKFFKRRDRRKVCYLCKNNIAILDYKEVSILQRFISDRGKILPRRMTGSCSKHQRLITRTVKTSRNIALLPFAAE